MQQMFLVSERAAHCSTSSSPLSRKCVPKRLSWDKEDENNKTGNNQGTISEPPKKKNDKRDLSLKEKAIFKCQPVIHLERVYTETAGKAGPLKPKEADKSSPHEVVSSQRRACATEVVGECGCRSSASPLDEVQINCVTQAATPSSSLAPVSSSVSAPSAGLGVGAAGRRGNSNTSGPPLRRSPRRNKWRLKSKADRLPPHEAAVVADGDTANRLPHAPGVARRLQSNETKITPRKTDDSSRTKRRKNSSRCGEGKNGSGDPGNHPSAAELKEDRRKGERKRVCSSLCIKLNSTCYSCEFSTAAIGEDGGCCTKEA